jgi:SAM-dependent methyltransferase
MSETSPRPDPAVFWNGAAGERWVRGQTAIDRMLHPLGRAALDRAAPAPGERIADVGCGCGSTTLELAAAVGPTGSVVGLDVSAPMLARAKERAQGLANVAFVEGDAAALGLDPQADLLFSRFGVMFFPDPERAFANLHGMLRPGGRLTFVCWRALDDNAWAKVPFEAVVRAFDTPPPAPDTAGPGPFAFADAGRVRAILEAAGFSAIRIEPFDQDLVLGETLAEAVDHALESGMAARFLVDADEPTRARARRETEAALAPHASGGRVALGGATWIVTAAR